MISRVDSAPVNSSWLFLIAYTASGLAGLIYEVVWTRLLTLYMGHTTAAASTVVGAFMGGLAAGSWFSARHTAGLSRRQALYGYVIAETAVLLSALTVPLALTALSPILSWSYQDGEAGARFGAVRLLCSFALLSLPAASLGATFPLALRAFAGTDPHPGRSGGWLYAANTAGAAIGAIAAGFVLIPAIGLRGATIVGGAATAFSIAVALMLLRSTSGEGEGKVETPATENMPAGKPRRQRKQPGRTTATTAAQPSNRFALAAVIVALSGAATFILEIAWTRAFAMIVGPSTYAFAATLAALIAGTAVGSMAGSTIAARTKNPSLAAGLALFAAALATVWAAFSIGGPVPRELVAELAQLQAAAGERLDRNALLIAKLILPVAIAVGVAFPLALELAARGHHGAISMRLGYVYAINTLSSVAGSLMAGFVLVPAIGLEKTIHLAAGMLLAGALLAVVSTSTRVSARLGGAALAAAGALAIVSSPPWDRTLLASGGYKYAHQLPAGVDSETAIKAGTLLYYQEGASATVTVKRLTGELSMAIDGKVDASNGADMMTQQLLAHLPLLLHEDPQTAAIIGLGSGVTLASALTHPVKSVDVVEVSPEVVEASQLFGIENRAALADPRTRLIVGDGRSHLALTSRQFDVIVSEPSNPWIAGVAALFTQEYLQAVRRRLSPGGIVCQWAHTYDISDADLRSIVATFASVFPDGTMWLAGDNDLLLIGSDQPIVPRLDRIEQSWRRTGVADDLRRASIDDPFNLLSLYVGGPGELARFAEGHSWQTDDRMALEFTAPRAVNAGDNERIVAALHALLQPAHRPPSVARAFDRATAAQWRSRAQMMRRASSHNAAYLDYATALALNPADRETRDGLVRSAVAGGLEKDAIQRLEQLISERPSEPGPRLALSKLRAVNGEFDAAVAMALAACDRTPPEPEAFEQLASLYADLGDATRLAPVVARLQSAFPDRPPTAYYAAALGFLRGELAPALGLAQKAATADPADAAAQNLLGAVQASLGRTDAARAAFTAALRIDPADSTTYQNLALLELDAGNRPQAAALFAEALVLDPASRSAREGLTQARLVARPLATR